MHPELQRLWIRITADRKKFATMCGLALVGLLLWSRLVLLQDVPRTGMAQPNDAGAVVGASDAAPDAGSSQDPSSESRGPVYLDLPDRLARNIFLAPPELLPQPAPPAPTPSVAPKSQNDPPDPQEEERRRIDRITQEAGTLRLDGVILGRQPAAIINGRRVTPGGSINDFVLLEVFERSVVLEREQVRVELRMVVP